MKLLQLEDSWISGLAPLGRDQLVLLTVLKEKEENGDAARPQLIVVEPQPTGFQEVCSDVLSIRGHERYASEWKGSWHLACMFSKRQSCHS